METNPIPAAKYYTLYFGIYPFNDKEILLNNATKQEVLNKLEEELGAMSPDFIVNKLIKLCIPDGNDGGEYEKEVYIANID